MNCVRFRHFARLNPDGTVSRCGHMVKPPRFESFNAMNASEWNQNLRDWPDECIRCRVSENEGKCFRWRERGPASFLNPLDRL